MPPGTKKLIETELETILLVNVEGRFWAVSNTCPHAGGWLNYGPLTGYIIECPLHYWPFDVRTGCLESEMMEAGYYDRLYSYPTSIENGEVFIELPPQLDMDV